MTTYLPKSLVMKSLREVRDAAREQGRREGYAQATQFVRMASSLNGSTHAVLKALEDDGPPTPRNRMADVDGGGAADRGGEDGAAEQDVMLAALDALIEAKTHHPETDGGPVYAYLANLLADPEALAEAIAEMDGGDVVEKASRFDESKHPRGDDGRFIGREQIHAAKSDPQLADKLRAKTTDPTERKKLEAALSGEVDTGRTKAGEHRERVAKQRQDRAERVKRAQELANEISMARRGGAPVPSSHFRELAEVLPSMTVNELRSVRGKLAASFGGERRKSEMAARLLEHAKNKAALLETNERYEDMDALDFGSLDEYQSLGNAKGNERENPNPEAEHGGRMAQRHTLMANLPESSKTSHGTPDTGSVLKVPDQRPEPVEETRVAAATVEPEAPEPPAIKLKDRKQPSKPKTDTLYSHVVGAGGIDPKSVAFLAHYSGVNHAVENGLSRGLFKNGGRGLDQIVRELHANGHISGADEAEATENLLEGLRTQGYSNHADRSKEYDAALDDYYRKQQEAHDAGHTESEVAAAIRSGEEAAESEVAEGAGGEGREDVGDAFEGPPESSGNDSFDFGEIEAPQVDPFSHATTDHTESLRSIPRDSLGWVGGHRVRHTPDGQFQIETQKTYHTGTAQEVSDRIKDHWRMASGQKNQVNAALDRAASFQEPDWFGGGGHADAVLRRRSAVPPGARGVSLEPNTRGRTGEVVRDEQSGQTHLLLDGGKEIKATDFEPLESKFSWRVPEADKPKQERAKQGDLFATKPATSDTPVSPAIPPDHAAALSSAAKHHRRMNFGGKPIPPHVVYTVPEHRNSGGHLIDPARINATSIEGQTGRELLAGKIPHYTIHGVYEFGKDGQPRRVDDTQRKAIGSADWDTLRSELGVKRGIVHDDGATPP